MNPHTSPRLPTARTAAAMRHDGGAGRRLDNRGFALVAALLLVAVVGIVAATGLQTTSTDIHISGNYKRAVRDFYAADAGLAEARARLRNTGGTAQHFIGDPRIGDHRPVDPSWTAYIVPSFDWSPSVDPGYTATDTTVQHNSLQTDLPYWVKIRHKTEYDAERMGHTTETPHYADHDGNRSTHLGRGNVIYFGYPPSTVTAATAATVPVAFTTTDKRTPWLPIDTLASHGSLETGGVMLTEDIIHPPGPPQLAALYASGTVTLDGATGVIDGNDWCGAVDNLPPIASRNTSPTPPNASAIELLGTPADPRRITGHPHFLDAARASLAAGATTLETDRRNQQLGTPGAPMVFLAPRAAFPQPEGIRLHDINGHGILLVDGNATLSGHVQWHGMILVTGTLTLHGQGGGIVIRGGLWAGHINHTGNGAGPLDIRYDSCSLRDALLAVPVQRRNWREAL